MAALVDQESGQGADRVGSEAFALPLRTQRDVHRRVLVHRIRLLDALDEADGLAFVLDHKSRFVYQGLHRIGDRLGRVAPPSRDLWVAEYLTQQRFIAGTHRPQSHPRAGQDLIDQAARLIPIARRRLFNESKANCRISLSVWPYSVM